MHKWLRSRGWFRVDTSGVVLWTKPGSLKPPLETLGALFAQRRSDLKYKGVYSGPWIRRKR